MYSRYGYGLSKAVKTLLIINVAIFVVAALLNMSGILNVLFGLTPNLVVGRLMVWQFFTYMFLHGGIGHIGFNMFALWMFGTEIEHSWGSRDFIKYYVICGIGGGVLVWLTSLVNLSDPTATTIGASGAIYGILLAYGLMWPDRMIYVMGVLPMKALHFVIIFGAIDLFQGFSRMGSGVAYFAHVGGIATGYIYLKYGWRMMVHVESFSKHHGIADWYKRRKFTVIQGGRKDTDTDDMEAMHPDLENEVDRILDKIAREGMDSLDNNERRILDRASRRKK